MVDRIGQHLGNYRLVQLLGRGSFAEVYLGEHFHLGSQAALKILHGQVAPDQADGFLREARTIARLQHPHVVRVLDFGVQETTPFLVMEYAPGGTLRQAHPKGSRLPLDMIVSYVKQVASALQYAHDQHIIHRDLKPENLLLGFNQEILLSDFGLALLVEQTSSGEHLAQEMAGTLAYMAPEQFQGHPDVASDQYALGVMVYEWLCGERPFAGSWSEIAIKQMQGAPPSLSKKVPTISAAGERVVLKALAKEPQLRFGRVQDFAQAFEDVLGEDLANRTYLTLSKQRPGGDSQRNSLASGLPLGIVTLLFSDIERSTWLIQQLGDGYGEVLSEYRSLLRAACQQWNGHEVDTQGDAFFAVFTRTADAVSAAVEIQHTLTVHAWLNGVSVRARIGLHTGEPQLAAEGYVGLDVHHAAHVMRAGHGGQMLLSQTTHDLVEHGLPDGISLRDLGEHRLKDLQRSSHLYQLIIADLPADFPALRTLDTAHQNLPVMLTSLIGREREVAAVQRLLRREDVRLLTLTGPGGAGKTRLGLQVAAELSDVFSDGVYFVNLAPISDSRLVVPTIAQTLDLKESGEQTLLDGLKMSLRGKQVLLLLDNFEQVVSAASQIADLLIACPKLKILVTSRAVLHVYGEQEFAVPPLSVPDPTHMPDLVALSQYEAVALFLARAQALKPGFQVSEANARAVAEICVRLDGLPLAIELAAARIKLLPPHALLARLGQRLAVLTSGAENAPARQKTLRNTIAWSYDLLDTSEQALFRRFSVFVGGCSLEAIEAVCQGADGEQIDVLNTISSLIDKSLMQQTEQEAEEPRIVMLETIREYGLECLRESKEAEMYQRAHALFYLAFAEEAEPHLKGAQQVAWWKQLEQEQENLRAALAWLIGQEEGELALRLSGALWWFWHIRGYWSEGSSWLEAALGLPQAQARTERRAKALVGAAEFAHLLGHPLVHALIEEGVAIYREVGNKCGLAEALVNLGWSYSKQNDDATARRLLEESVALTREAGDSWLLANALQHVGIFMNDQGEFKSARLLLEESVTLYRALQDKHALSGTLHRLVDVVASEGDLTQATVLAKENLALARELDNGPDITGALYWLAHTLSLQGDVEQAVGMFEESLALAREQGDRRQMGSTLLTLASLALYRGDLLRAGENAQESLSLFRELRVRDGTALALSVLGDIKRREGDLKQARAMCTEGVLLARELDLYSLGFTLISLAKVAASEGQPEQATRLFAVAESLLNPSSELDGFERADYERTVEGLRASLGEKAFAAIWAEGRDMTAEQALATPEPQTAPRERAPTPPAKVAGIHPDGLTAREVDVLRLLAQGHTDTQIAEQLIISPRTVNNHLTSIYSKLGVTTRSAATRYAIEHNLA